MDMSSLCQQFEEKNFKCMETERNIHSYLHTLFTGLTISTNFISSFRQVLFHSFFFATFMSVYILRYLFKPKIKKKSCSR